MPHTFRLEIDLSNEEFDTPTKGIAGVQRLLRAAADYLDRRPGSGRVPLRDVNGNTVGFFDFDASPEIDVRSYAERAASGGSVASIADGAR